jgi:myo-inositol-hexaphosphate 3-phosphohydrolase
VTGLVEVLPELWVRPEQVAAVVAFDKTVKLYLATDTLIFWEFEATEPARAFTKRVAAAVNSTRGSGDG